MASHFAIAEAGSATHCETKEHVPAKLYDFADKNMLQFIDLARILVAQVIPPERKAR